MKKLIRKNWRLKNWHLASAVSLALALALALTVTQYSLWQTRKSAADWRQVADIYKGNLQEMAESQKPVHWDEGGCSSEGLSREGKLCWHDPQLSETWRPNDRLVLEDIPNTDIIPADELTVTTPATTEINLGTFWTINKGVVDDAEVSRMARSINEAIPDGLRLSGGIGEKVFESVGFVGSTDGKRLYADDTTTGEWVSENEGNLQIWNDSATAGICIDFQAQRVFNMHCSAPPTPEDWAAAGGAL